MTNPQTFDKIKTWMESIYEHADHNVCKVLCGNKIDLANERKISTEQGRELAKSYGVEYCEVSAKTGQGLSEAFEMLIT